MRRSVVLALHFRHPTILFYVSSRIKLWLNVLRLAKGHFTFGLREPSKNRPFFVPVGCLESSLMGFLCRGAPRQELDPDTL